jgi:hypothetical protein
MDDLPQMTTADDSSWGPQSSNWRIASWPFQLPGKARKVRKVARINVTPFASAFQNAGSCSPYLTCATVSKSSRTKQATIIPDPCSSGRQQPYEDIHRIPSKHLPWRVFLTKLEPRPAGGIIDSSFPSVISPHTSSPPS